MGDEDRDVVEAGGKERIARRNRGAAGQRLDQEHGMRRDAGDRRHVGTAEQTCVDHEMRIGMRQRSEGPADARRGEQRATIGAQTIRFKPEARSLVMMSPKEAWPAASSARPGADGSEEI